MHVCGLFIRLHPLPFPAGPHLKQLATDPSPTGQLLLIPLTYKHCQMMISAPDPVLGNQLTT